MRLQYIYTQLGPENENETKLIRNLCVLKNVK